MRQRPVIVRTKAYGNFRYPLSIRVDSNHTRGERNDVALCLEGPVECYVYLAPAEARALAVALETAAHETDHEDGGVRGTRRGQKGEGGLDKGLPR